jgi:hypothetical protein
VARTACPGRGWRGLEEVRSPAGTRGWCGLEEAQLSVGDRGRRVRAEDGGGLRRSGRWCGPEDDVSWQGLEETWSSVWARGQRWGSEEAWSPKWARGQRRQGAAQDGGDKMISLGLGFNGWLCT